MYPAGMASVENYEERVRHGIRDLLRQMDYHCNPSMWVSKGQRCLRISSPRLLANSSQIPTAWETSVTISLAIHTPAHGYESYVCLPDEKMGQPGIPILKYS